MGKGSAEGRDLGKDGVAPPPPRAQTPTSSTFWGEKGTGSEVGPEDTHLPPHTHQRVPQAAARGRGGGQSLPPNSEGDRAPGHGAQKGRGLGDGERVTRKQKPGCGEKWGARLQREVGEVGESEGLRGKRGEGGRRGRRRNWKRKGRKWRKEKGKKKEGRERWRGSSWDRQMQQNQATPQPPCTLSSPSDPAPLGVSTLLCVLQRDRGLQTGGALWGRLPHLQRGVHTCEGHKGVETQSRSEFWEKGTGWGRMTAGYKGRPDKTSGGLPPPYPTHWG